MPPTSPRLMRLATGATLAVTAAIVVSGAAVRLSDSGLGCPSWPNCQPGHLGSGGLGLHGAIEFGNRLVTAAITVVVGLTAVLAWRFVERRRDLRVLSGVMVGGIVANAVVGGLTVYFDLTPLLVSSHFLLNMALLWVALSLHRRTRLEGPSEIIARPELVWLTRTLVASAGLVLVLGTLTTGTGPHAGSDDAPRLDLPLDRITAAHADIAMLVCGLVLALLVLTWVTPMAAELVRRIRVIAVVIAGQAALGFVQYLLDLPASLVLLHVAGATALWMLCVGLLQDASASVVASGAQGFRDREDVPIPVV